MRKDSALLLATTPAAFPPSVRHAILSPDMTPETDEARIKPCFVAHGQ